MTLLTHPIESNLKRFRPLCMSTTTTSFRLKNNHKMYFIFLFFPYRQSHLLYGARITYTIHMYDQATN